MHINIFISIQTDNIIALHNMNYNIQYIIKCPFLFITHKDADKQKIKGMGGWVTKTSVKTQPTAAVFIADVCRRLLHNFDN